MKIKRIALAVFLACAFQVRAAVPSGPPGGATNNTVTKWTGTNSLGGITNGSGFLSNNGSGVFTWAIPSSSGSGITNSGVGTNNYLTKWTGTNSLGTSQLSDDGTNITTDAGNFLFSTDLSTIGVLALGGISLNPNAALTLFNPMAWSDSSGPYLNGTLSGGIDIFTLGLDDAVGSTKTTQRIKAARGLTDGVNLEVLAGDATDGRGGRLTLRSAAGVGTDQDGGDLRLFAGNATGSGTDGNIILTAGTAGVVDVANSLVLDTVTASTLLKADSGQIVASIANAVGILTNDGAGGLGFSTNISQAITINNFTVTNLTVQSNLVVNQSIKLQGKELGSTHINGTNVFPVVNITNTASVTWAVSGSNITATASGGDTTATNVVTLTMTGTNVSAMDYDLVKRGGIFKLVMTGNAYIGAPQNVTTASKSEAWLQVMQPSTGTCVLTFTNLYCFSEGVMPVIDTNNSSVSVFQLVSDVFTNGLVHGSVSTPSKRTP